MVGNIVATALFVLFGLGFFANGARGLWIYATNRTPAEITCAEYFADPPDAEWLTLTECHPRLDDLAYESWSEDVSQVFIPLGTSVDATGPITLVVVSEESKWISLIERADTLDSDELVEALIEEGFGEPMTFSGSLQMADSDRDTLRSVIDNVSDDAALVEHNERPDWEFSLAFTLFGLGLAGFGIKRQLTRTRRRRRVMRATAI